MNTQHTPGPLHNVTGARPGPWIRQVLNDESEAYIHDKHCNAIARVYSLSDAALIAAAPAMYEALKTLHGVLDQRMSDGRTLNQHLGKELFECFYGPAIAARAAIAKAEGRQA